MTTIQDTQEPSQASVPALPETSTPIMEGPPPDEIPPPVVIPDPSQTESTSDAPRKQKRRSGNSVDLTYRYHEPSDDELSWTEDEHGTRRRRKSQKRKSGGGDDFKTGIVPTEGKKRRKRRRSGHNGQDEEDHYLYSGGESGSDPDDSNDDGKKRTRRKRMSGKSDDFRSGIVPREGKSRRKKRKSTNGGEDAENEYYSDSVISDEDDDQIPKKQMQDIVADESHDFKTDISRSGEPTSKKGSSTGLGNGTGVGKIDFPHERDQDLPEFGDGWTNVEWTILEHTHDHFRSLGEEDPESIDAMKLAEAFLKIYETSEFRIKAEKEGKERKEFSIVEVRDRIIALRKTRERRKSGELPPAKLLNSPGNVKRDGNMGRRLSGLFRLAKFW